MGYDYIRQLSENATKNYLKRYIYKKIKIIMKKIKIILILSFICIQASVAQKFGYVDTEYILNKIPDYKKAQKEIDKLSAAWQSEIEDMYKGIDKMYKA